MKSFHFLKGGREKVYPVLRGARKVSDPRFSHFVAPPPPPLPGQKGSEGSEGVRKGQKGSERVRKGQKG